jgi:hypothetical protein
VAHELLTLFSGANALPNRNLLFLEMRAMNRSLRCFWHCLLIFPFVAVFTVPSPAGSKKGQKALPPDLAVATGQGAFFVSAELGKVFHGPEAEAIKKVSRLHPIVLTAHMETMKEDFGFRLDDLERIIAFGDLTSVIVTTRKPLDRKKTLETLAPNATKKTAAGKSYYVSDKQPKAVYPINDRSLLIGTPDGIKFPLERLADTKVAGGELQGAIEAAADRPLLIIAMNPKFFRETAKQAGDQAEPFLPLLEAKSWRATLQTAGGLRLRLRAEFANDEAAKKASPGLAKALAGLNDHLDFLGKQMPAFFEAQQKKYEGAKELAGRMEAAMKAARVGLKAATPRVTGNVLEATAQIRTDQPITDAVLLLSLMPRTKKK